jgi:hypothetical protein
MKKKILLNIITLLIFLISFNYSYVFGQTENPPDINEDKVVIGQTFVLKENQILNGELAVIGGSVNLMEGSLINGDIAIIGGVIDIEGTVNGDIHGVGGTINLENTARVTGSVYNFSTNLTQAEGAIIEGQQIASLPFDFGDFGTPNSPEIPKTPTSTGLGFLGKFLWAILQIMAMGALAMIVVLIIPKQTDRISRSITKQPFVHWGIGLLTSFTAPAVFLVLIVTILLIPLSIIGITIYSIAMLFGWISLGYTIGKKLFASSSQSLSPALLAGLGTIFLTAVARLGAVIPCVGWLIGAVLSLFGLGAVILTRFGTREYPVNDINNGYTATNQPVSVKKQEVGSILANVNNDLGEDLSDDLDEEIIGEESVNESTDFNPEQENEKDGKGE